MSREEKTPPSIIPEEQLAKINSMISGAKKKLGERNFDTLISLCAANVKTTPEVFTKDPMNTLECVSHAGACEKFCELKNDGSWDSPECTGYVVASLGEDPNILEVTCQHLALARDQKGDIIKKYGDTALAAQDQLNGVLAQLR